MATTVTLKPNAIDISGSTSGTTTLQATAVAGTTTLTLPAATDTLVGKATTDTLTNKTLTSPTITGGALNGTVGATTPSTGAFTTLSATGNVTLGDASTDTLNVGNGGLIKDASGNLGLGVTPSAWSSASRPALQLPNGAALFTRSGSTFLGQNFFYNSSDTGTYIDDGFATLYNQANGQHQWFNAPSGTENNTAALTPAMTLNANGVLALQGASTSATGVGITFPATQSASTDANTLDDYEEGTWTPGLTCGTSGTITLTSPTNSGLYTKVGRQVTAYVLMGVSSVSLPVGTLSMTGLPFNCNSTIRPSGTVILNGAAATAVTSAAAIMIAGSTTTFIYTRNAAGINNTNAADIQASTDIYFSITYFV